MPRTSNVKPIDSVHVHRISVDCSPDQFHISNYWVYSLNATHQSQTDIVQNLPLTVHYTWKENTSSYPGSKYTKIHYSFTTIYEQRATS